MAYEKQSDIQANEGETVVKLTDSGQLVAVQCTMARDDKTNMVILVPSARWIDATATVLRDSSGRPVSTVKSLTISPDDVARLGGASVVMRECQLLVLGEPLTPDTTNDPDGSAGLTIIPWSADIVQQCSIRNAIAAAQVTAKAATDVL